jgi:hypothetical protein
MMGCMPTFDVFVDGPTNDTPQARQSLAEAMSSRYGLGVPDLLARMAKGKFRVKAKLDEPTAQAYARDLESIGARVSIAESVATGPVPVAQQPGAANRAKGSTVRPPAAPPPGTAKEVVRKPAAPARSGTPSTRPADELDSAVRSALGPARASSASLPPATGARAAPSSSLPPATASRPQPGSSLPPATTSRPQPGSSLPPATASRPPPGSSLPPPAAARTSTTSGFASGLSAAFTEPAHSELGALDGEALSLSALDGSEEAKQAPASAFGPPPEAMPASIGPAPSRPVKAEKPKDVPLDLFAPPDEGGEGPELALTLEEDPRKRGPAVTDAPAPIAGTPPKGVVATPMLQKKSGPVGRPAEPIAGVVSAESPRWRFAAGVLIAVILGFVPASLIASARESSAFEKIDAEVIAVQEKIGRSDGLPFDKLDEFRATQLSRKQSERRNIALVALVMWAAIGGGLAYVWFRKIRWKT